MRGTRQVGKTWSIRCLGKSFAPFLEFNFEEDPNLDRVVVNTGATAEIVASTELLACSAPRTRPELFYWHREKRNSNAEVDYVTQVRSDIVPVEVKAGTRGAMRSLRMFLESHRSSPYGVRTSLEPFSEYGKVRVCRSMLSGP